MFQRLLAGMPAWAPTSSLALALFVPLAVVHPAQIASLVGFISVTIVLVWLPGYLTIRRLLPATPHLVGVVFGMVIGFALNAALGAVGARFGALRLTIWLPLVCTVFAELVWRRPRPVHETVVPRALFVGLGALIALSEFLLFVFGIGPESVAGSSHSWLVYQDSVWTIGNTVSIRDHGLPLRDIRFDGMYLGYHVAQNLYQATLASFGIEPWFIHLFAEPILDRALLVVASVLGASFFFKASPSHSLAFGFVIAFTDGYLSGSHSQLYWNNLSYAFSLPPLLLFFFVLWSKQPISAQARLLLLGLTFFLASASKGSLLPLLMLSLGLETAWRSMRERRVERADVATLGVLGCVGVLTYLLVFRAPSGAGYGTQTWPVPENSFVLSLLAPYGAPGRLLFAGYHIARPALQNAVFVLLGAPGLLALAGRRVPAVAAIFCISSIGVISVFNVVGGSSYFILYPQVLLSIAAVAASTEFRENRLWRGLMLLALAIGSLVFARSLRIVRQSWAAPATPTRSVWDERATVDLGELEGLVWLRANTLPTAVFVSNRRVFRHEIERTELPRFFAYSAYAERTAWAEGDAFVPLGLRDEAARRWAHVDAFFQANGTADQEKAASRLPADYIVECLRFAPAMQVETQRLPIVFENASIRIRRNDLK